VKSSPERSANPQATRSGAKCGRREFRTHRRRWEGL
jgi:hypothetical protein